MELAGVKEVEEVKKEDMEVTVEVTELGKEVV